MIKWLDFGVEDATWVPARWCDCADLINRFEMDSTDDYDVEKVLDKRVKCGEVSDILVFFICVFDWLH